MALLRQIQKELIEKGSDLGPTLLKMQLLAARLGSQPLEEWVRLESEGYPPEALIPTYRVIPASFTGSFVGAFGAKISNAPIPPYLVEKHAGEKWVRHRIRQSVSAIDDLLENNDGGGSLTFDAADLIVVLTGHIYPQYNCIGVTGRIGRSSVAAIRHIVRSRLLELTLKIESEIPQAANIELDASTQGRFPDSAVATRLYQQIFYGPVNSVATVSVGASNLQEIVAGDKSTVVERLVQVGIDRSDAIELADIIESEQPGSASEPLGRRAQRWVAEHLHKAAAGAWNVTVSVATDVIKQAALAYYGLT